MVAIDPELFEKTFTTVPRALSPQILSLCQEISPNHSAMWVPVQPEPNAVEQWCFHNVQTKIEREGGSIVYGWAIWEWPRVFIEAEHHAVWNNDDTLLDITPHVSRESRILFLPDPNCVYDYEGKNRITNVKRSLEKISSATDFIKTADTFQKAMEANSVGDEVSVTPELLALGNKLKASHSAVIVELATKTKVNDRCICNSGRKFKKCCAPLINLRARNDYTL